MTWAPPSPKTKKAPGEPGARARVRPEPASMRSDANRESLCAFFPSPQVYLLAVAVAAAPFFQAAPRLTRSQHRDLNSMPSQIAKPWPTPRRRACGLLGARQGNAAWRRSPSGTSRPGGTMKVLDEIAEYLAHKTAQGLTPHSVHLCKQSLLAVLGPALDDEGASLTPLRIVELGGQLRQRPSPRTGRPLAEGTLRNYLAVYRAFVLWRSLRKPALGPSIAEPPPAVSLPPAADDCSSAPNRLGELARLLRQAAGLERQGLAEQTGLTATAIRNLEHGRDTTPEAWRALIGHPAMVGLREIAEQEGIELAGEDTASRAKRRPLTVGETIDLYLDALHDRGLQNSSLVTTSRVLRSFFRPSLQGPLSQLCPERARELAEGLPSRISPRTKRPLAPTTCTEYRAQANLFLRWCAQQNRLPQNPLDPSAAAPSAAELQEAHHGNR